MKLRLRSVRCFGALLAAAAGWSCGDKPAPPVQSELPREEEPLAQVPSVMAPRPLSGRTAIAVATGAHEHDVFWGAPEREGAGLWRATIDHHGALVREPTRVWESDGSEVVEIAVHGNADAIAAVWVTVDGHQAQTWSALASRNSMRLRGRQETTYPRTVRDSRGDVAAVVAANGSATGVFRETTPSCQLPRCSGVALRPLGSDESVRLSLPGEMASPIVGIGFRQERLHYVVRSGESENMLYAIGESPRYAEAENILSGCRVRAFLPGYPGASDVSSLAECHGTFKVATADRVFEAVNPPGIRCNGRSMSIAVGDFSLPLGHPTAQLDGWLQAPLVGEHATVVWTGAALLALSGQNGELRIARYVCSDGALRRSDHD